jgi:5-methylcytosine-specific restriction endonuclease McrA
MSRCISAIKREKVFFKYEGKCAYCGCKLDKLTFHVDHIVPMRGYGRNDFQNLNPSCSSCNISKSKKLIEDWRKSLEDRFDDALSFNTDLKMLVKFKLVVPIYKPIIFYFEQYGR